MDCLTANSISTFGGNPLADRGRRRRRSSTCSSTTCRPTRARSATQLLRGLRGLAEGSRAVGEVRGKGLMAAIELVRAGRDGARTQRRPPADGGDQGRAACSSARAACTATCIRLAPPMTLTEEEADEGLDILADSLRTLG